MAVRLPLVVDAEYRGREAAGGEFRDTETGEVRSYGAAYRFEVELPDGDVTVLSFREDKLAEVCDFDLSSLGKGDALVLDAIVNLADRGTDKTSYMKLVSVRRASAVKLAAAK